MIKPSVTRRRFITVWEEIEYLYRKAAYWLDYRKRRRNASRYVERLKPLVEAADPRDETILGAACRALIADFDGNLAEEIRFTRHKIKLLEQLLNGYADRLAYNWQDVLDEYEILVALYEEADQPDAARRARDSALRIRKRHRRVQNGAVRRRSKAS